jgi:hypothetical protein
MRPTLALVALCGAVLVAPTPAVAKTVRTGSDDLVNRVRIAWRARCEKGRYTSTTLFVAPFDSSSKTAFEHAGTSHARIPGGYRARHTASVSATLAANGVWHGTFEVRTRVSRNGKFVDRCRLKRVDWTASPVG